MSISAQNSEQVKTLAEHITSACGLPQDAVETLRRLAVQLDRRAVIPLIGAGGSYDCGVPLARDVAKELYEAYTRDAESPPSDADGLQEDLGAVADLIGLAGEQKDIVDALGLEDEQQWPAAGGFSEHFCVYRVFARLAREGVFQEALTFNYDCAFEAALRHEGFLFGSATVRGEAWRDHATVVADAASNASLWPRGAFVLFKVHGSAERYRERLGKRGESPQDAIVIRRTQLLDWRRDLWARDVLSERARRHVLLLIGFSGQDPVIHVGLTRVLEEVYEAAPGDEPRVVVLDRNPDALMLKLLIKAGRGGRPANAKSEEVTQFGTAEATTTGAALVLLAELLALRLESALRFNGVRLPAETGARLAALIVAAPTMLQWTFLLGSGSADREWFQRANAEQAAEHAYIPLTDDRFATAELLSARRALREGFGLKHDETVGEALAGHGFVVKPGAGRAFLPVRLSGDELAAAARRLRRLELTRLRLRRPRRLDCVLVPTSGKPISIDTGQEVELP
jgi:hypothetical protein